MQASIISGIREYLKACPILSEIPANKRHISRTEADSENFGIIPDGTIPVRKFINGGGKYQYAFTLVFNKMTAEDETSLKNIEFIEKFQEWCSKQSLLGNLPELPENHTATKLEAIDGILSEIPKNQKYGKYLIECKLYYIMKGSF